MGSSSIYSSGPLGTGRAPAVAGSLYACTCGAYASVIPPEPCPIHDPERAYWRRRLLAEFGGNTGTSTTTNTASVSAPKATYDIPKYEPPKAKEYVMHYNYAPRNILDKIACGADPENPETRWARVLAWVNCEKCKRVVEGWTPNAAD
jgi:hypothetical protein